MEKVYDNIILGAGPAGLSAAIYSGRARVDTLLIQEAQVGGQVADTNDIQNYPGQMVEGESGPDLVDRMSRQVDRFGADRVTDTIQSVDLQGEIKVLHGLEGDYRGKNVILATGSHPRRIGCKNEDKFIGKGISFCATCDANFFEDYEIYVVGGGDAAVEEAIYLTRFAKKVTIIHRRDKLRATESIQERAFSNDKLDFIWDSVVEEVEGDPILNKMVVRNVKTDEKKVIEADPDDGLFGLFVFIGHLPNTDLFKDQVNLSERGYVVTDENMQTNIPGVYAAGDVREKAFRQVVTACADGAIAALMVEKSLTEY